MVSLRVESNSHFGFALPPIVSVSKPRALSPSIRGKTKTSRTGGSLTNGFCSLHGGRNAFTSSFEWSIRLSVLFVIVWRDDISFGSSTLNRKPVDKYSDPTHWWKATHANITSKFSVIRYTILSAKEFLPQLCISILINAGVTSPQNIILWATRIIVPTSFLQSAQWCMHTRKYSLRRSQRSPVHPGVQVHLKPPPTRLTQVPLFAQGSVEHGSRSVEQLRIRVG